MKKLYRTWLRLLRKVDIFTLPNHTKLLYSINKDLLNWSSMEIKSNSRTIYLNQSSIHSQLQTFFHVTGLTFTLFSVLKLVLMDFNFIWNLKTMKLWFQISPMRLTVSIVSDSLFY